METIVKNYQIVKKHGLLDILQPKPTAGLPISPTLYYKKLFPTVYGKKGETVEMVKVTYVGPDSVANIAILVKLAGKKKNLWMAVAACPDTEIGKKISEIPDKLSLEDIIGRLEKIVLHS